MRKNPKNYCEDGQILEQVAKMESPSSKILKTQPHILLNPEQPVLQNSLLTSRILWIGVILVLC